MNSKKTFQAKAYSCLQVCVGPKYCIPEIVKISQSLQNQLFNCVKTMQLLQHLHFKTCQTRLHFKPKSSLTSLVMFCLLDPCSQTSIKACVCSQYSPLNLVSAIKTFTSEENRILQLPQFLKDLTLQYEKILWCRYLLYLKLSLQDVFPSKIGFFYLLYQNITFLA